MLLSVSSPTLKGCSCARSRNCSLNQKGKDFSSGNRVRAVDLLGPENLPLHLVCALRPPAGGLGLREQPARGPHKTPRAWNVCRKLHLAALNGSRKHLLPGPAGKEALRERQLSLSSQFPVTPVLLNVVSRTKGTIHLLEFLPPRGCFWCLRFTGLSVM